MVAAAIVVVDVVVAVAVVDDGHDHLSQQSPNGVAQTGLL